MQSKVVVFGLCVLAIGVFGLPLSEDTLVTFSSSSDGVDPAKNYVLFVYDSKLCTGDAAKTEQCRNFEQAVTSVIPITQTSDAFSKFKENIVFAKVDKDQFPKYKKEFERAKISLPAVAFWPAGHFRPTSVLDVSQPNSNMIAEWLSGKLRDELSLIQESTSNTQPPATVVVADVDPATLVCQASNPEARKSEPECTDAKTQGLMQLEKTQKIWDFKIDDTRFLGPADNSLPHDLTDSRQGTVHQLDLEQYKSFNQQKKYIALYFYAPWCKHCDCLEPIWQTVSDNLVGSQRQPNLVVGKIDGDANTELRSLFNITVYPTFLLVNDEGTKVLGRYLGPRKTFELSNWIEDLIVANENPIVKQQFDVKDQGEHPDLHPVFPYSGSAAFGVQELASLSAQATGNDFDECVDSDEKKFTAPGAALLVHYSSDPNAIRALEMDSNSVSTAKIPEKLMVVDFFAPWCPHCQKLNPVWDTLNSKFANSQEVTIGKVDVEAHADVKRDFGIHRFPTILFFEPGKPMSYDEARRYTGQRDIEHLEQWVNDLKAKYSHRT